jgi:hypothetical protein
MKSMNTAPRAAAALLLLGVTGAASAQLCQNTCVGAVSGPSQGVHSQFDTSADAIAWPPNHKLRGVTLSAVNEDGDSCDVTITDVRQDEPVRGTGSGNTTPDAANCTNAGNESSVDLRGERSGTGTGRYYNVSYTMKDPDCSTPAMDTAYVLTPHDQGVAHLNTWVNEGPLFDSDDDGAQGIACAQ